MFVRNLLSLLPVVARVSNAVPVQQLEQRGYDYDDSCVIWGGGQYQHGHIPTTIIKVITTELVHYQVPVDQYCESNTIVKLYGIEVTVNNAPTHLRTIAWGQSTATYTALTTILPYGPGKEVNIYQKTQVNVFPVTINSYITNNGIIQQGGVNIIVNNAPTSISTVVNGTSTVTSTVTVTTTQGNANPTPFILAVVPAGLGRKARRDVAQVYVGDGGAIVASCQFASIFTISNGQLSSGGQLYSTNTGTQFGKFAAAGAIGDISTTFSAAINLAWTNAAFFGGAARFCALDSFVYSLFGAQGLPNCATQDLVAIRADLCQNGNIQPPPTSSTAGPTTSGNGNGGSTSTPASTSGTGGSTSTAGTASSTASSTAQGTTSAAPTTTSTATTSSTTTTSATSTTSTAPPVCLIANNQVVNTAGNACICAPGFANSSGTAVLVCTPIPDCTIGPNQLLNTVTNTCVCRPLYADSNPNAAILDCTFTPNCDITAHQVLDIPTNACKCTPGFIDLIPGAPLVCSPDCTLSPNQVLNPAGTACICAPTFADSNTLDTILTCTLTPTCVGTGQILDPTTNSCKCNSALGFASINPTGVLTCATCLAGIQVLNPVTNVCTCAPPRINVGLPGAPLICL